MADIINCERCQCPTTLTEAKRYESRNSTDGSVEVHYVCGETCLMNVFNEHYANGEKGKVLNLIPAEL
jgi:hypothetical protein